MAKELVHVYRGDYLESVHYGSVAVVDVCGTLLHEVGDAYCKTFMRSSAKPIQAMPIIFSGAQDKYNFTSDELAVMCASHNGEDIHVNTVRSILKKIGVAEEKLSCGTHMPYYKPSADALIREGKEPLPVQCNCSGKHSAMLALSAYYGWDMDTYIQVDHPCQQMMIDTMSEVTDVPRDDFWLGIDGCGVPVFGLPLYNMALAYARLSRPDVLSEKYSKPAEILAQAMYTSSMLVAGTGRFCTDLMRVMQGKVVAKTGAEAVYTVGIMDKGIGIAVKVSDGGARGKELVVLKVMEDLGLITQDELAQLDKYRNPIVKNHHQMITGSMKPAFSLK